MLEAGAEGRVLDAVDVALQTDLGVKGGHAGTVGAEVGVIIGAEEHIQHAIPFGSHSEKSTHGLFLLFIQSMMQ